MIPQRRQPGSAADTAAQPSPPHGAARPRAAAAAAGPAGHDNALPPAPAIDWPQWLRATERKRRLLAGRHALPARGFWAGYYVAATDASFRLDGLAIARADLAAAVTRGSAGRAFRSRQQQRARNHVAILRHLEKRLRHGDAAGHNAALKADDVVRWYTSIACGLSTTRLDEPTAARLDGIVRQINSPHLRLCPALQGIARLHCQLLADPVVPSFNGILARLLLHYHLGRCGLPPVLFAPDAPTLHAEPRLLARLLERIAETYELMLGTARGAPE